MHTQAAWIEDVTLQAWLVRYGEIVWDDLSGKYVLQSVLAAANAQQEDWAGSLAVPAIVEEADAEGEVDFDVEGGITFSSYN